MLSTVPNTNEGKKLYLVVSASYAHSFVEHQLFHIPFARSHHAVTPLKGQLVGVKELA